MLNEAIINLYVNNGTLKHNFNIDTKPENILTNLTLSGIKYTWETVREEKLSNTQSVIEVRVYLPEHIAYGRYVYSNTETQIANAHLYAISNAIKTIVNKQENTKSIELKIEQQESIKQQPLSQEEIMNIVKQNNEQQPKITTAEQFVEDERELIPFDEVDLGIEELDKLISGKAYSNISQQTNSFGFTQEQINAIKEFKEKMNITSDAVLCSYINSWDSKLSKKEDLTPDNIDAFIEWTKNVGKAPC